jgi:hypothetical protein
MEQTIEKTNNSPQKGKSTQRKKASKNPYTLKRISPEGLKMLNELLKKVNEDVNGISPSVKLKDHELLTYALKRLTDEDVSVLQESRLSYEDRMEILYKEKQKLNKRLTKEEFLKEVYETCLGSLKSEA